MTTVNLEIGGTPVRVASPRRISRRIRSVLREHLTATEAPLGFIAQSQSRLGAEHVLLDRCGFLLGTASGSDRLVALMLSHLAALLPPRSTSVRLRVRALMKDSGATLCLYPLLFVPPIDEQLLAQSGHTPIDRLAIDIDARTLRLAHERPPWEFHQWSTRANRLDASTGAPVVRVVVAGPTAPSHASVASALAGQAMSGNRETVLDTAVAISSTAELMHTNVRDAKSFADYLARQTRA